MNSPGGRFRVRVGRRRLRGRPRSDGTYCPPLAIWAITTGRQAAINIKATAVWPPSKPYRFNGLGDACTLGNWRAAAHVKGIPLYGLAGYLSWRGFVLAYLPVWEKKVRLLFRLAGRSDFRSRSHKYECSPFCRCHAPSCTKPGQDIVREGEVGQSLYIIVRAKSKCSREPRTADRPICKLRCERATILARWLSSKACDGRLPCVRKHVSSCST